MGIEFYVSFAFLSLVVFICLLLAFISMLQNRLYFIFIARQINAIREYLLQNESRDFKNNQLYTSTNFSACKIFSVHSFLLVGSALLCALFGSTFFYSLTMCLFEKNYFCINIFSFFIIFCTLVVSGFFYLSIQSNKTSDIAIHGSL